MGVEMKWFAILLAVVAIAYIANTMGADYAPKATSAPLGEAYVELMAGKRGTCSGSHIGNGFVVTAAHCLGRALTVDGTPAEVLWSNPIYDIAMLYLPGLHRKSVEVACNLPAIGDRVTSFTYPKLPGGKFKGLVYSEGYIAGEPRAFGKQWRIIMPVAGIGGHGSSGGMVLDSRGRLIGLLNGGPNPYGAMFFMVPSAALCMLQGKQVVDLPPLAVTSVVQKAKREGNRGH